MQFSTTTKRIGTAGSIALLASTMLCTSGIAYAQEPADTAGSDAIVVTAQRRTENLQDVPIAITAFGTEKLDQLQVQKFEDYARYLPSVSYQTSGPGSAKVYFRGVASGENANHSASQPSVGIYLDEQPITTIQGALDINVYDIARVEALAGPQGTLYGSSSQAGTIRIITNKPDATKFEAGGDFELNSVAKGGEGYVAQGFINTPFNDNIALRVVGWYKKDAGYIDNIAGSLTFPSSGITMNNAPYVEKDYNDVTTYGGRAALKIDLDDNWTVTPQIMGQKQKSNGSFAVESGLGDLQTMQFNPEGAKDNWYQAALTIEGKIGTWDVTYAGSYLKRKVTTNSDYADYSYFYDKLAGYGNYFYDNNGDLVNPNQYIQGIDRFTKQSHELRFASPADAVVRFVGGAFYQRQTHNIRQNYIIDNIADSLTVPGTASNIWLTEQYRVDRDYAVFGELTADVTDKLAVTFGTRIYKYDNSLVGFFGYSAGYSSRTGVAACFAPTIVAGSPCTNLDKSTKDTGFLHKINATYKFTPDALVYFTTSRGYRPGGINRRGDLPPYSADFIDNYEAGWKTSWAGDRIRFNGAIYQLNWQDLQISILGANGLTQIQNAGKARIRGFEAELWTRPADGLTLSSSISYNDAKLTKAYCGVDDATGCPAGEVLAPKGTRLPVTAKVKANAVVRYEFPIGSMNVHMQAAGIYEGRRTTDLRPLQGGIKGDLPAYATLDTSIGVSSGMWTAEIFATNLLDKRAFSTVGIQCLETVCGDPDGQTAIGPKIYRTPIQPRLIGVKAGFKF
ncbi:TonB-dependent receptor [Sphingobium sp. BS19]|uniref:TonB-dependent receptor n=1 Tax=Sphingobium sp. BS19 TaxID=3018973 RepID=UPI0022EE5E59|nr:TonB-dependent receptor [Sphingobium sp. BS19]GLI97074.1 TonB-dependent receptor [Sphingobium sp. BS19]